MGFKSWSYGTTGCQGYNLIWFEGVVRGLTEQGQLCFLSKRQPKFTPSIHECTHRFSSHGYTALLADSFKYQGNPADSPRAPRSSGRSRADPVERRAMTAAGSASRNHRPAQPTTQQQPRIAPSLSCRQLLQQRCQKYRFVVTFSVGSGGPQHDQRWMGSFWIGGTEIGRSGWERTKDNAKESAARAALNWLNTYGYHWRFRVIMDTMHTMSVPSFRRIESDSTRSTSLKS
jgi:dienelactone hydrolase